MLKTLLMSMTLARLGAGAHAAQPSDPMHDTTTTMATADTPTGHDCPCLHDTDCEDASMQRIDTADTAPDFALTLRQHADDHFVIEGEGYERIQWASLEGSAEEMLQLADAAETRVAVNHRRVALAWDEHGPMLTSPRNSQHWTRVKAERLAALVLTIRAEVARAIVAGPSPSFDDS